MSTIFSISSRPAMEEPLSIALPDETHALFTDLFLILTVEKCFELSDSAPLHSCSIIRPYYSGDGNTNAGVRCPRTYLRKFHLSRSRRMHLILEKSPSWVF